MTFRDVATENAVCWKATTTLLPDAARRPAPFFDRVGDRPRDVCLPAEFAQFNLLPPARDIGIAFFNKYGIKWQGGDLGQPSNHLLSSQVQCVNVLAPLMKDPVVVRHLFEPWLPIVEVLPFEENGVEFLTFEWTGAQNYLGEFGTEGALGHQRKATSADAGIRFTNEAGETEIALIEWKYVETYPPKPSDPPPPQRLARYRAAAERELDLTVVPFEDLFVEPFYQLMRLQLLASEIEAAGESRCQRARLIHVAPSANRELLESLPRPSFGSLGHSLYEVWSRLLRAPDRFVTVDSAALWRHAEQILEASVWERYSHLAS